ncbi:putative DNA-binding protein [Anaerobacillus sp. MEB173]|uniref:putative DNA-binding protein n=1 Tax=Anaerobacillus sp. MEB173 TaxID=3383345 RepID=UPI003F8DBF33
MLEKKLRMNYLYDFYQPLLTDKQQKYMSLYYLDDLSLGEIAEEFEVSRQAVYDNIKRTETMLEEYEAKLNLFRKFEQRTQLISHLKTAVHEKATPKEILELIDTLEKLD